MSEGGFHVHGAHEQTLEHEAHHGPGLAQYIAIFTAILANLRRHYQLSGGATQNSALLLKTGVKKGRTVRSPWVVVLHGSR